MKHQLLRNALVTFASFIFVITVVSAWTAPTGAPPTNNVSAPITVSTANQEKFGGLTAASLLSTGGIRAFGRVQVGSTLEVCEPAVAGSLRWNAGVMQYCDGINTWKPFTGGGVSSITNGTCAVGQVVQSISATGAVTCGGGVSSITGGSCGVGQVVKSINATGAVTCIAALGVAGGGVPNAYCGQCFAFSGNEGSNSGIQQNCLNGVITSITPCSVYVAPWGN